MALAVGITGLTGIEVRVEDTDDQVVVAPSTTGVDEFAAGAYDKAITFPVDAGTYRVIWSHPDFGEEPFDEVEVSTAIAIGSGPTGAELATLAQVRQALQKQEADVDDDELLEAFIRRASKTIQGRGLCGRIRPSENGATKTLVWDGGHRIDLFPFRARAVSAVTLDPGGSSPTVLAAADFRPRPASPLDGAFTWLRFPNHSLPPSFEAEIEVTGDWGYDVVPDDVNQACIITVVEWLRKDVAAMSTAWMAEEGRLDRPEAIPRGALRMLVDYTDGRVV
jgi:hypothetical protein